MASLKEMVDDFLAQKRIAVAGVSRNESQSPANMIYRKLHDAGYEVFPINPRSNVVENATCYRDLKSIPGGVDAIVVVTPPQVTDQVVRQCPDAGVSRVWIHRSLGQGSASESAVTFCRDHDIRVIPSGCPMMFCQPVDFGHKCLRWVLGVTGRLQK